MAKRNYWQRQFDSMNSIYDRVGNINYEQFGNISQDEVNRLINYAKQKGWGSVNIGGKNYTLYNKNDATGQIMNPTSIKEFDPNKRYTASQLAVYNYNNRNNKDILNTTSNYDVTNIPNIGEQLQTSKIKDIISVPEHPEIKTNLNNINISNIPSTILSQPTTGRKSQFRNQYLKLFNDPKYLDNDNEMLGYINKYYGMGWNSPSSDNYNKNTLGELQQTANWISSNNNLLNDRSGKGQEYLAMESSRLNRKLGGYDFTYRDMLNYFNNHQNIGNIGKYNGDNSKFMQELYELGASRNGMQEHELRRLFGDNYDEILGNIGLNSLKKGGIIEMLFI